MGNRRRSRRLEATLAASLAGAGLGWAAEPPAPQAAAAPRVTPAPASFARYAVLNARPARAVFYTWTTEDQVDELLRTRLLLSRDESPVHGAAWFDQVMARLAAQKDPLATLLRTRAFTRARFAWPSAWPTALGWEGERYGDRLIRVALKPSAWIAALHTATYAWRVFDLDNRAVPVAEVLAHPERLAAVYFVQDEAGRAAWRTIGGPSERAAYREYVLCNESMIDEWSVGTGELVAELTGAADALEALAPALGPRPASVPIWNSRVAGLRWAQAQVADPLESYEAALAFPNERYAPGAGTLEVLVSTLRQAAARQGSPTRHRPDVRFPSDAVKVPAPPPRVKPGPWQTY